MNPHHYWKRTAASCNLGRDNSDDDGDDGDEYDDDDLYDIDSHVEAFSPTSGDDNGGGGGGDDDDDNDGIVEAI